MRQTLLIILLVVLVGVGIWWWRSTTMAPATPPVGRTPPVVTPPGTPSGDDSMTAINQDVQNIDISNIDSQFQSIDSDINSL